ncbi:MAG: geranylgeranylglycerol-phosphate geranylgeranyltransferase [Bacteroidales bacterium]|nr:geranylgeranylglycerol-phosphate geranylgeranyltransferase [Bacteroidales bacterium]MBQ5540513.1 geranylgeranylglycerol-phosphate geranylgeranyltransferase [Bacteroidales bacterium]MBR4677845.1 geranylgeranylglycerol-phosphate geranylgeranyltransferase [Bacteroidales bacterium]
MMPFLRLVRYKNLLMIAFAMFMTVFCIINPMLKLFNLISSTTALDTVFIILACVLIAAGGYVINDYFDTKIDRINRPETLIVTKSVGYSTATKWHIVLSVTGCLFGFLVSARLGIWKVGFMYPIIVGLLWFYSSAYKKMFLVGNIVVAVLSGLVMVIPALYEMPGLMNNPDPIIQYGALDPFLIVYQTLGVGIFAFLTSLTREIIKDMEDEEGDKEHGARTLAVVFGKRNTKIVVTILNLATVAILEYVLMTYLNETISIIYINAAVVLPLMFLSYKVLRIKDKKDCHFCSIFMKITMLLGILYLFVMRYNFLNFKDEF